MDPGPAALHNAGAGDLRGICGSGIATWAELQSVLNAGGTVTLTRDITAGSDDTMLQVSGTVTLDLNGHTLNRNRTTAHADGHVLIVNAGGKLTIRDSAGGGTITGGYANNGGGINNKGTLRIEGGAITGNRVATNPPDGVAYRGGGNWGGGGTTTVNGGYVSAHGGIGGAGIGGGGARSWHTTGSGAINAGGGSILITGGDVTACGGENGLAPGIGHGENAEDCGGSITITYADSNPSIIVTANAYGGTLNLVKRFTNTNADTYHQGIISGEDLNHLKDSRLVPSNSYLVFLIHPDHGEVSADTLIAFHGDLVTLSAEPDEGYRFAGWSVVNRDTREAVAVTGDTFVMPDAEVEVSAVFEQAFTVTFDPGEGTGTMADEVLSSCAAYVLPACGFTAPEGMGFKAWSVVIGEAAAVDKAPGDSITVTADTTVTAVWDELRTVSFDANGGTGAMAPVQVVRRVEYILPENGFEAPDGMRFKDWTIVHTDGSSTLYQLPGYAYEVYGNITLQAMWQPIPFGTPDFILPTGLTAIEASAFEGIAATAVQIPANCASIGDYAFKDCECLNRIRIPAGCELGTGVFDGCGKVYVYGTAGSTAEAYCQSHSNCVFVEEGQN